MMAQSEYERQRDERIAANRTRLAELVTMRLEPQAAKPVGGARKRAVSEPLPAREKSSRARAAVNYAEPGEPGEARSSRGERGEYGTADATSCHSCRQKTSSYKAECTQCPLRWCAPCLRIRYGEEAVDANATGEWLCGRCRGGCLCSNCRRKEGKVPTGILGPRAEAAGYSSVAEYLDAGGS